MRSVGSVDQIVRSYDPVLLCIVYSGHTGYIETREIKKDVLNQYAIGPAKPFSKKHANKLRKILGEAERTVKLGGTILNENILYSASSFTEESIIWYRKAGKATIKMKGISPKAFEIILPTLVFHYDGDLHVFATTEKGRPTKDTDLMILPFRNTDELGNVCMGNNHVNDAADVNEFSEKMELLFFKSRFTHGTAPLKLWKEAMKEGKFPIKELRKTKHKLINLLER